MDRGMRVWTVVLVVLVVLALAAGLTWAQGSRPSGTTQPQEGTEPEGGIQVEAIVANVIPIQGRLTDASGNPLNGSYSITVRIYNRETGGTHLCAKTDTVDVVNGLFDMTIDNCDPWSDVNGQQLYLEFYIGGETLAPRRPIYPVPYAWTLRPGAVMRGVVSSPVLRVYNDGTGDGMYAYSKNNHAVYGESEAADHSAIAADNRGGGIGLHAYSDTGVAIRASGTGIIQSTAVSRIFVPGIEAVPHEDSSNALTLTYQGRGAAWVQSSNTGRHKVVIPVQIPAVLYGQPVRIVDMRVHYNTTDSHSGIAQTYLYRQNIDGTFTTLISNVNFRNSTAFTYYHLNCSADACTLGHDAGILAAMLTLEFDNTSHRIRIGGIRLTLAHE